MLPHAARRARVPDRRRARPASRVNRFETDRGARGRLLLQTLRSHDQYNTTIYGLDDRYRGIKGAAAWCS